MILATSADGKPISVKDVQLYLNDKDKKQLAQFIYDRLYGRYLKSFDYPAENYHTEYKSGFLLMASCCLLIETYISFTVAKYRSTRDKSGPCFGEFFTTEDRFIEFSDGGRQADGKLSTSKQGGIPNDFYSNVRCGILHSAETKNGWRITRTKARPLFDKQTKQINATKFANRLKTVLSHYKTKLIASDFDNAVIWDNFRNRIDDVIKNS
jgi:hypothetical protein